MNDITKLKEILDWKLLKGSHKYPGPDGGTCINEAAIIEVQKRLKIIKEKQKKDETTAV